MQTLPRFVLVVVLVLFLEVDQNTLSIEDEDE